jgi:transcription elongation factor GreA
MERVEKFPITLIGLKKLEEERNKLKNIDRPNVIKAISAARELGDLSENAEYHAAREQQSFIEGRIQELEDVIARANIIDPKTIKNDKIVFSATVTLEDLNDGTKKTYQIVGEYEASLENNLISYTSPLGKALIGKTIGDVIDLTNPKGTKSWEVMNIEYK